MGCVECNMLLKVKDHFIALEMHGRMARKSLQTYRIVSEVNLLQIKELIEIQVW